jgi:hypothetical protein
MGVFFVSHAFIPALLHNHSPFLAFVFTEANNPSAAEAYMTKKKTL